MSEQKINVKNTYVATVKKDVADSALSFYAASKENDIFVETAVFPSNPEPLGEVNFNEVVSTSDANNQNVVNVPKELKIEEIPSMPTVENIPVNDAVSEINNSPAMVQSEVVEPLTDIPNLNVLEPIPNVPSEPVNPQPIPNPVNIPPSNPTPFNDNFENIDRMVNEATIPSPQPVKFDASHETNLLNALGENNNGQSTRGNINVTPENLNLVREFGVDEPIVNNPQPAANTGGFVNSKILLVIVIILFLASCMFLGYELYNYFILSK